MSVIVGIVQHNNLYMGSDGCIGSDEYVGQLKDPKIFRLKIGSESILVGCAGSWRAAQVIKTMHIPRRRENYEKTELYLIRALVPRFRQALKEAEAPLDDFEALLGYKGRLFEITSKFGVVETRDQYAAIGCGYLLALGSLASTEGVKDPERRIIRSLVATAKHSPSVSEPFFTTRL